MSALSRHLRLFLIASGTTGILIFLGWLVAEAIRSPGYLGALFGGAVGTFSAGVLATRYRLIEPSDESTVSRSALAGFFGGLLAGSFLTQQDAVVFVGLGAVLGRWIEHFFDQEPPQRIF
jgi:hypothetical protein